MYKLHGNDQTLSVLILSLPANCLFNWYYFIPNCPVLSKLSHWNCEKLQVFGKKCESLKYLEKIAEVLIFLEKIAEISDLSGFFVFCRFWSSCKILLLIYV